LPYHGTKKTAMFEKAIRIAPLSGEYIVHVAMIDSYQHLCMNLGK